MTWIETNATPGTEYERVLGLRPELLARYKHFYGALWDEELAPPRLLELARLRIAAIHDCQAELAIVHDQVPLSLAERADLASGDFSDFDQPLEQAVLQVAEQMPHAHHFIADEDVEVLKHYLDPSQVVALMTAMAMYDVNCRLRLTFGVSIESIQADQPASAEGSLY